MLLSLVPHLQTAMLEIRFEFSDTEELERWPCRSFGASTESKTQTPLKKNQQNVAWDGQPGI